MPSRNYGCAFEVGRSMEQSFGANIPSDTMSWLFVAWMRSSLLSLMAGSMLNKKKQIGNGLIIESTGLSGSSFLE
jgi:hypothetical protein